MKKKMFVVMLAVSLSLFVLSCGSRELPDKGVTILGPKVNDVVPTGSSYEIQWKTEVSDADFGAVVTIEFSSNDGKSWQMVADNVANGGKYAWKVPKIDSAQCKVRIFSQFRPEYRGTSGIFAVK